MKIAGRKNDGAWFRTNEARRKLSDEEKANLAGSIDNSPYIDAAYNALVSLMAEAGIQGIDHAANTHEWATAMANDGIPRQVWYGNLSWTSYSKIATTHLGVATGGHKYVANYQPQMRAFAKDLRFICKRYFLTRRQTRDLFNSGTRAEGNPSGMPDANSNQ